MHVRTYRIFPSQCRRVSASHCCCHHLSRLPSLPLLPCCLPLPTIAITISSIIQATLRLNSLHPRYTFSSSCLLPRFTLLYSRLSFLCLHFPCGPHSPQRAHPLCLLVQLPEALHSLG
ncbi:unnamed protein product, partial [Closterium sp. NIES-53]